MGSNKQTVRISCTNIRGLDLHDKLNIKMNHILNNIKSDIKILVDSHADNATIDMLMKEYKQGISQFNIIGNQSRHRGVTVLINKILWVHNIYCETPR